MAVTCGGDEPIPSVTGFVSHRLSTWLFLRIFHCESSTADRTLWRLQVVSLSGPKVESPRLNARSCSRSRPYRHTVAMHRASPAISIPSPRDAKPENVFFKELGVFTRGNSLSFQQRLAILHLIRRARSGTWFPRKLLPAVESQEVNWFASVKCE